MLATVLAVLGTLLGSTVTGTFHHLTTGRAERTAATEQLRRERLEAVTALAAAGTDHRRALRRCGEALLRGGAGGSRGSEEAERLGAEVDATHAAFTRPLVALRLLVPNPAVHAAAHSMVAATCAMADATGSAGTLTAAEDAARAAHEMFVDAAAAYFNARF